MRLDHILAISDGKRPIGGEQKGIISLQVRSREQQASKSRYWAIWCRESALVPYVAEVLMRAGKSYSGQMATMFIQQSTEYIQQIEAEIERLEQLRDQVQATIRNEEELEAQDVEQPAPRKRAANKGAGRKAASKKVAAKKRGRPRASEAQAQA